MNTPPTDLLGDPIPASHVEVIRSFVEHVKMHGPCDFNGYRFRMRVTALPRWIGSLVAAACRRAGLVPVGFTKAKAPASRSRLCLVWGVPVTVAAPALAPQIGANHVD